MLPDGINVTGVLLTFSGNVSVGGTLTYEDVTNVDSVGIITARSGLVVTGVVTRQHSQEAHTGDGTSLTLDTQDLTIRS